MGADGDEFEFQLVRVAEPEPEVAAPPAPKRKFDYGKPSERTPAQHHALAARMRERKAQHAWARRSEQHADKVVEFINGVNKKGMLAANLELCATAPRRGDKFGKGWRSGKHAISDPRSFWGFGI